MFSLITGMFAGLFLGTGCIAQNRIGKGGMYPLLAVLMLSIFVITRGFSSPCGMLIFFSLLLVLYLIYWFDVIWFRRTNGLILEAKVLGYKKYYGNAVLSVALFFLIVINGTALTGYRIYHIPSASMMPTLIPGDYVLVDHWAYDDDLPSISDVVVFHHPFHHRSYIKRIAYLPNETFMGKLLAEKGYAVLGDNTDRSEDSRAFGSIKIESIMGRACYVVFSLNSQLGFNAGRFLNDVALHKDD